MNAINAADRDMVALCASTDPRHVRACDLTMTAIITFTLGQKYTGNDYCLPRGYNSEQLRRLYVAAVPSSDLYMAAPSDATILYVLRDAFPCPPSR